MGVHQHTQHAKRFIVMDESHAAHVGGQLENDVKPASSPPARRQIAKVASQIFDVGRRLVPFLQRLNVDRADNIDSLGQQVLDEVAANEASSTADSDSLVLKFQRQYLLGER